MKSKLVLIAGGTASGKTTIASSIAKTLENDVVILPQDIYYKKEWDSLPISERLKSNFDHPSSFDVDLILEDIKSLQNGKVVKRPKYIYSEAKHSETEYLTLEPKSVIIFEGLFALYYKDIRDLSSAKIYVDADDDIRILRRLNRDTYIFEGERSEYGKDIKSIISNFTNNWNTVIKVMHNQYIFPTKSNADIVIPNNEIGINKNAIILLESSIKDMLK